jgi:hypothetical protein
MFALAVLGIEPRVCTLGDCSTTKLQPQSLDPRFYFLDKEQAKLKELIASSNEAENYHNICKVETKPIFFFVLQRFDSGPHAKSASILPLEPFPQPFLPYLFFSQSLIVFVQAGFRLPSSYIHLLHS